MRRRRWILALAVVAAVVLVAALLWIVDQVGRLEADEQAARGLARHEDRIRLALWRMDSALAGFLAYENALAVDPPAGFVVADPPFLERRFELGADSASDSLPEVEGLLALLEQPELRQPPPVVAPPPPAPPPPPPVELPRIDAELETQAILNTQEFSRRQQMVGQQANFVDPSETFDRPDPAEPPEERDPVAEEPPPPVEPSAAPPPDRPAPARVVEALQPVWWEERLLLVRRVERGGGETLQGLELDTAATRGWLLDQVGDLLPAADVVPVGTRQATDPGRQLALLPWRLAAGPPPSIVETRSSVRLGLGLATAAILVALLALAVVVASVLHLARRQSDFAAAVIHELRTPLTTFRFYTDMLAEGQVPESERPRYLVTLRQEADRLGHLVENVLAYARVERVRRRRPETLALDTWLNGLRPELEARVAEAGLELAWQADLEPVSVVGEAVALERILHNLCNNSIRYAAAGGRVELTARVRGAQATIDWRDHGPGIDRARWRKLFRPFQRHHDDGGDVSTGLGLGLALSRQLARRFGGELQPIQPEDGDGICLRLTLRVAKRQGRDPAQGAGKSVGAPGPTGRPSTKTQR